MSLSAEQSLTLPPEPQPLMFIELPDDVMHMVVDHLTDSELNRLARTCKASYTVCNWELYKRDSQTLNPQALLWGVFTGQIRPMEFAISQYNADINQVFIWPPRSRLFKDRVKEFALVNAVNVTITHMSRVSFRGSDDTGFNRFAYEQGPCPRPEQRVPWTALHFAAVFNQVEATKFLLQNGADHTIVFPRDGFFVLKDLDDPLPRPPLFTALKTKSEEVAEVLLRHGASPLWAPPGAGKHAKETSLVIAARLGMWRLLELIVRAGVDVNAGCHVNDVPKWSTDPAGQPTLRTLYYLPGSNSQTRKPTEKAISELVRLGASTTVRDVPGRQNMVHLVLQLIVGYRQGRKIKSDWPLASILLRTGACDGTLEIVEVLAAIQLALFPKKCPYTPILTRHTQPDLTSMNKKCREYSIKACFVGTRCKCKLDNDRHPEDDPANGRKWQTELLQELVRYQVRYYGWRGLHDPLPFLTETVLTLLARHRHVNTTALDIWLGLMPDGHKTRVVNVQRQTALHIALNIESFDEKLWYIEGKPTKDVDRVFVQRNDVLFYLLQRCTSEELLAVDVENCTPLQLLLGALYWDQDEEYFGASGADLAGSGKKAGPAKSLLNPFPRTFGPGSVWCLLKGCWWRFLRCQTPFFGELLRSSIGVAGNSPAGRASSIWVELEAGAGCPIISRVLLLGMVR